MIDNESFIQFFPFFKEQTIQMKWNKSGIHLQIENEIKQANKKRQIERNIEQKRKMKQKENSKFKPFQNNKQKNYLLLLFQSNQSSLLFSFVLFLEKMQKNIDLKLNDANSKTEKKFNHQIFIFSFPQNINWKKKKKENLPFIPFCFCSFEKNIENNQSFFLIFDLNSNMKTNFPKIKRNHWTNQIISKFNLHFFLSFFFFWKNNETNFPIFRNKRNRFE